MGSLGQTEDSAALKHAVVATVGHALRAGCAAPVVYAAAVASLERGWLATASRVLASLRRASASGPDSLPPGFSECLLYLAGQSGMPELVRLVERELFGSGQPRSSSLSPRAPQALPSLNLWQQAPSGPSASPLSIKDLTTRAGDVVAAAPLPPAAAAAAGRGGASSGQHAQGIPATSHAAEPTLSGVFAWAGAEARGDPRDEEWAALAEELLLPPGGLSLPPAGGSSSSAAGAGLLLSAAGNSGGGFGPLHATWSGSGCQLDRPGPEAQGRDGAHGATPGMVSCT